ARMKGDRNWALLVDDDGFLTEGTGDNFFLVREGKIFTPEPRNILRGVSRGYIFELAAQLGIRCHEQNLELFDAINADEAFVTGTPFCMLPVGEVEGQPLGQGKRGDITQALLDAWSANVGVDIEGQIRAWNAAPDETRVTGVTPYQFERKQ